MPVSDDTMDCLDQVKKGKPRKFVMLVKGTTIVSLVMFKKGNFTKFIKQAKEEGKGIPFYGVVGGKGMDINFQLAVSDGFDKPPVKNVILKKYLEEEADFKCKPLIEIVENTPVVFDADDPLHARFLNLQSAAFNACESHPDEAEKIGTLCRQIGALLDAEQREQGEAKLEVLEDLLKGLSGPTLSPDEQKQLKTYEALRAKIEPMLLRAKQTMPDKVTALWNVWNYAEAQAEKGNYPGANKGLAGLAEALMKATTASPTPAATTAPPRPQATGTSQPPSGPKKDIDVAAVWRNAKTDADDQLNKFAEAMRKSGSDYLAEIAQGGIHSFVEGPSRVFVTLQTSLLDYQRSEGQAREKIRNGVLDAVAGYRQFLDKCRFIDVCDANKLCGPMNIRATLETAVAEIENAITG